MLLRGNEETYFDLIRGEKKVKMSALHSKQISNRLLGLQRFIPREFVRKPRSLSEILTIHGENCLKRDIKGRFIFTFYDI